MKKRIIIPLLISVSILGSACGSKGEDKTSSSRKNPAQSQSTVTESNSITESYFGQWNITKVLAYGPVGTYSENDVKNIVGKKLTFSKTESSSFGDNISYLSKTYQSPIYNKTVISQKDFEAQNKITFSKLGITASSITKVSVNSNGTDICYFYIKDNDTLILSGGGTYFELKKGTDFSGQNSAQPGLNKIQVIDNQCFNETLESWGKVRFVSGVVTENYANKATFYLTDEKGNVTYQFPDFYGNQRGMLSSIAAVSFQDLNKDGLKDIIVIANYITGVGQDAARPFPVAGIYLQKEKRFEENSTFNDKMNNSLKTIDAASVSKYAKENLGK